MEMFNKVSELVSKNMSILVVIVATIALFIPSTFLWVTPKITILLGVIMFGMGMTLKIKDFQLIFQRPQDVIVGALAQFTIMPFLAWAIVKIFDFPPEIAIGIILVGTCPGGTASNVITFLSKGDVALSISMTMLTTILAPVVTPALIFFSGRRMD